MTRRALCESLEQRRLLASIGSVLRINFQTVDAPVPDYHRADTGSLYARRANGLTYGWTDHNRINTRARIARSGDVDRPLDVALTTTGAVSAIPSIPQSIQFAAGEQARIIDLPLADRFEGRADVTIALQTQWQYANCIKFSSTTIDAFHQPSPPPPPVEPPPTTPTGKLSWSKAANAPAARTEHMTAMVGERLYLMGGYFNNVWLSEARMDVYNPATNNWQRLADIPQRLTHAGTAHDDRYIYLAGGYTVDATGTKQVIGVVNAWRYDTVAGHWSAMPSLPQRMGAGSMVLVGRKLYHMGGFEGHITRDSSRIFALDLDNLSAGWKFHGNMPETNNHFGAAVLNGSVYVMAGQIGNDATAVFRNSAWRWDVGSNAWTRLPNITSPGRSHIWGSTFAHNGRIFVIGGETSTADPLRPQSVAAVDVYDPSSNSWSRNTSLPSARSTGSAAIWQGKVIFTVGMLHGQFKADTWIGSFV
jgi:N-acetylneuraminic acid mutarotase